MNEEGREMAVLQDIEEAARCYFQNLFTSGRRGNNDCILSGIERCIHVEDHQNLTAPYTREEITEAMFDMGPMKLQGRMDFQRFSTRNVGRLWEKTSYPFASRY